MAVANKSEGIDARARRALKFAQRQAKEVKNWIELHNALFGMAGKVTELFPSEAERTAFSQTDECKQIFALMNGLPVRGKDFGELVANANGAISMRLPRTLHAALLVEAKAEGVSLNQLCLSKLMVQLRALV